MTAPDWSARYLGLAVFGTAGTAVTWFVDGALIIHVALVTAAAFAVLALVHAHRLRDSPQNWKNTR
jgi:hypothetical protein